MVAVDVWTETLQEQQSASATFDRLLQMGKERQFFIKIHTKVSHCRTRLDDSTIDADFRISGQTGLLSAKSEWNIAENHKLRFRPVEHESIWLEESRKLLEKDCTALA